MTVPAIVAFKNPMRAKQRLAGVLNAEERAGVACTMLSHVLAALKEASEVDCVIVVGEGPETAALCAYHGVTYLREPVNGGYNDAITFALHRYREKTANGVVVLASDLPLIAAREIDHLARACARGTVRIAVSRDGRGTNGLYLNPPDAIVPAFGEGSADRHCELTREGGIDAEMVRLPGLAFDLDTPSDLIDLHALQVARQAGGLASVLHASNESR